MKSSRRDTISISQRIASVFGAMSSAGVDCVVFTNKSPILGNEKRYKIVDYIVGLDDDSAAIIFLYNNVYVVTDSRYEIDLKESIGELENVKVTITRDDPEDSCYLSIAKRALEKQGFTLAVDERVVHSPAYIKFIKNDSRIRIKNIDLANWFYSDRPGERYYNVEDVQDLGFPNSFEKIFSPREEKLNAIIASIKMEETSPFVVFSNPSDIAWILNIRCFDCVPSMLPPSILILSVDKGYLFVQGNVGNKLKYELLNLGENDQDRCLIKRINIFTLDEFFQKAKYLIPVSSRLLFADSDYPAQLLSIFPPENYIYSLYDKFWFDKFKSVRTLQEIQSIELAFNYDSIAFIRLLCRIKNGEVFKTEIDVSDAILEERKKNKYYIDDSFPTISAFGSNGAICHYVPGRDESKEITQGLLVLDFGSQYFYGTTDNTRTICFGIPSGYEKFNYTAVLKAHIKLQMLEFPIGIDGYRLDFLARSVLYEYAIEVPHGIGHAVDFVGNVHGQFPRLSSAGKKETLFGIYPGMVFTIEPGSYIEGQLGVRIENTVVSSPVEKRPGYMYFKPMTLMPYDLNLIDKSMLDEKEAKYINDYHNNIYETFEKELNESDRRNLRFLTRNI